MNSPIDRSPDPNEVSHYAPKWARDFVLTVFLAALTGLVIVLVMPTIQSFVAKQQAGTGTDRSGSPPSNVEQRIAAIDPAATAPVVHQLPVRPTQPAVAIPGPANPAPATSLPDPAPA